MGGAGYKKVRKKSRFLDDHMRKTSLRGTERKFNGCVLRKIPRKKPDREVKTSVTSEFGEEIGKCKRGSGK